MQLNLKTTLRAFPKLSPSILENYVSKEELEAKDYVNHTELKQSVTNITNMMSDFVKDVSDDDSGIIYGRQKGKWVPVININESTNGIICWGINSAPTITPEVLLSLHRQMTINNTDEYLVEEAPSQNGYFWFASTSPIRYVTANNGLEFKQGLTDATTLIIQYNGSSVLFYCYRTPKLVALPNVTYKFKINIGDN